MLGCDSVLDLDGDVLGTPTHSPDAEARCRRMCGRYGRLLTGHCLRRRHVGVRRATSRPPFVRFGTPTDDAVRAYVATGEPLHVAGAFTIDARGAWFLDGLDGDQTNVVGASLPLLRRPLLGVAVTDLGDWPRGAGRMRQADRGDRACVASRVRFDKWSKAFYRVGLPVRSSLALRDAVAPNAASICHEIEDVDGNHDGVLLWLASQVGPVVTELAHWREVPVADLEGALRMWLFGEPEDRIDAEFAGAWKVIRPNDLETLVPWVLTAAADFVATELGRTDFRDLAHWRLAPVRLRYGVPRNDMCELVRDGFDRDDAIAVVEEFEKAPVGAQFMGLKAYSEQWRRAREAEPEVTEYDEPL